MTAPGDDVLTLLLFSFFLVSTGYAAGRLHQWYRMGTDRDEAYRDGYDTATRSVFSMAVRLIGPRRPVRATATVIPGTAVTPRTAVVPGTAVTVAAVPGPAVTAAAVVPGTAVTPGATVIPGSPAASVVLGAAVTPGAAVVPGTAVTPGASVIPGAAASARTEPGASGDLSSLATRSTPADSSIRADGGELGSRSVRADGGGLGGRSVRADGGGLADRGLRADGDGGGLADRSVRADGGGFADRSTRADHGMRAAAAPSSAPGGSSARHSDELMQAPTYRLSPTRIARATTTEPAAAEEPGSQTTRLPPAIPRPRAS